MNILVVDDEVSALRQIEMVLKTVAPDAVVQKTNKAKHALEMFRENEFDVVFLDIRMPGEDGLTLAKAKEIFAYLIDRKGASATNAELRAVLWGDDVDDSERQRNYFSQCVRDLRMKLEQIGCEDIFIQKRDFYAVVPERIPCDYYSALHNERKALSGFHGEYMSQYEWAEERLGGLGT